MGAAPDDVPEPDVPEPDVPRMEHFRPGGVPHALVSGLVEIALASAALGVALEVGADQEGVAASLTAAAALWSVLALYSLGLAAVRAWVFEATLDAAAVTLRGVFGTKRLAYGDISAVEIRGSRTRLVGRDNRPHAVRGVRGRPQGERFRARVLARASAAAEIADSREDPYSQAQAEQPDKRGEYDHESEVTGRDLGSEPPPED